MCFLDIDEFLVIKGRNSLPRFMAPLEPHFDAAHFNWVIYGTNGRRTRQPGSVLMGLTRRNRQMNFHTKNVIRARFANPKWIWARIGKGARAFWHFWDDYGFPGLRICDVLGVPPLFYSDRWPKRVHALVNRPGFQEHALATAYVAHFQFKSEADFRRRSVRSKAANQKVWLKMFEEGRHEKLLAENDAVPDTCLRDFWEAQQPRRELVAAVGNGADP